ncbi:hypothetical protein BC937DRAFT_92147 [Endogone sp. FLAS-F59071]|nr:hypothetical protein BC937DRAFT_92147 [Endogone sp. FLAS-F59071]|eukprot:RUS15675.1 hypothetical protein BC937DRAFT_92147 [Endogone sp. FLAS-F59071]
MFPRSQRFKDDVRPDGPGPGDYDPVNDPLNPHKRYGFLDKSGRWTEPKPSESSQLLSLGGKENVPSVSTSTRHRNGAIKTSTGTEEVRLRRELDELREQLERQKLAAQRDADAAAERLRKAETQAREAIKERNGVQAILNAKEHELAEVVAMYNASKANLEKAEKSAIALSDKTAKTVAMQRRLEDLEKANAKLTDQLSQARKNTESDRRRHQSTVQDLSLQLESAVANAAREAENTLADREHAWTIERAAIVEEAAERQEVLKQEVARRDAAIAEMREATRKAEEQSRERQAQAVKHVKNTLADREHAWTTERAAIVKEAVERQEALEQEVARREAAIVEMREAMNRAEEQSRERQAQAVKKAKNTLADREHAWTTERAAIVEEAAERQEALEQEAARREAAIAEMREAMNRAEEQSRERQAQAVKKAKNALADREHAWTTERAAIVEEAAGRQEALEQEVARREAVIAEMREAMRRAEEQSRERHAQAVKQAKNALADREHTWTIERATIVEKASERQEALEQEVMIRDATIVEMREAMRRAEEQSRERQTQTVKQAKWHEERTAEMQAWAKEMQSKVATLEERARQDGAAVSGLKDQVQRIAQERDEAARNCSLALRDLDATKRELESARRKGDKVEAELAGQAAALRDALEETERKVKRMGAELASRDVKIKEMEGGRVKQAEAEVGRLARVVTEKEKELVALRRRLEGGEGEAKRWQEVAVQAREMEEVILAEKEKLHGQLQESESRRTEIEEQLQSEVRFLMQKHSLAWDEMERVNGINAELMGHQNPRQRIKHVHKLKDENIALKKDNLALGLLRDEQRRKIMSLEREVESLRALGPTVNPVASRSRVVRHILGAENVMGGRSVIVTDSNGSGRVL